MSLLQSFSGLAAAFDASAQITTADLVGTVRDASGSVRPRRFRDRDERSNRRRPIDRDRRHRQLLDHAASPGKYVMNAELPGFRRYMRSGIELQVNQRAQVDIVLSGRRGESDGGGHRAPPLLESQSSVLGSVIAENQVRDLPLNGRNFVQLAILSPGVTGTGYGARGTIMSGTRPDDQRPGTELFVNGNRESSNNYLYDASTTTTV